MEVESSVTRVARLNSKDGWRSHLLRAGRFPLFYTRSARLQEGAAPRNRRTSMSSTPTRRCFTTVAKVGSIPAGEGSSFQLGNRLVAVFNHNGEYLAIDDLCPHMGASLGAGCLDEEGVVTCPWHAWRFDAKNGKWADNPRLSIDTFEVRVEGTRFKCGRKK